MDQIFYSSISFPFWEAKNANCLVSIWAFQVSVQSSLRLRFLLYKGGINTSFPHRAAESTRCSGFCKAHEVLRKRQPLYLLLWGLVQ